MTRKLMEADVERTNDIKIGMSPEAYCSLNELRLALMLMVEQQEFALNDLREQGLAVVSQIVSGAFAVYQPVDDDAKYSPAIEDLLNKIQTEKYKRDELIIKYKEAQKRGDYFKKESDARLEILQNIHKLLRLPSEKFKVKVKELFRA
jgi:hypothetical protein